MGRKKNIQPQRLPEKLLSIRKFCGVTQVELWDFVKTGNKGDRSYIAYYESGKLTPSGLELLNYVKYLHLLDIWIDLEQLIDDSQDISFRNQK